MTRLMKHGTLRRLVILTGTVAALTLAGSASSSWFHHGDRHDDDGGESELEVAEIFFELNDTDGDLGTHALIDGEPWKQLRILDPHGRRLLDVTVRGMLRRQGLTELFFESAEPDFDELDPATFFGRFPAGSYEVGGRTLEGEELESETELTHYLPAPPANITVNGEPATADECDEEELPALTPPVEVEWDAVTETHPELGETSDALVVIRYRAVAEFEDEEEEVFTTNVDVLPEDGVARYGVTFSDEFFVDGSEVKFEFLVREESYNQTAVESCPFEVVLD